MLLKVDTSDLTRFVKQAAAAAARKPSKTVLTAGVNDVGDGLVAVLATKLTAQTGLSLEQVRGMIKVKRANRNDIAYTVTVKKELQEATKKDAETLEGQREVRDFGKRMPGDLVIVVSKKDELVCEDCEELEAAGPMPAHIAMEHVPKHPECRCIIMPYVEKGRRLPVTMTSLTGTSTRRRGGRPVTTVDADLTLRQLAQSVMDRSSGKVRIELLK